MKLRVTLVCAWLALTFAADQAFAFDGIVNKETFELGSYTTFYGKTIEDVRIGYESYGKLNESKDNVILITHFFNGNSHAAGKYKPEDKAPGYWDSIIGSGKAIDTDKYFVLSSDTLVNLNVKDGNTKTTGPATLNPATGKPYGASFPVVTIRDFVNVQKALLDKKGIKKVRAVMGASMGALQAFEWGAAYPEIVERIIPVAGAPALDAFGIETMNLWGMPIMQDPDWNHGDYYGGRGPKTGLELSVKIMTLQARASGWEWEEDGRKPALWHNPTHSLLDKFLIEDRLDEFAVGRAKKIDANSLLYLARAVQLFVVGGASSADEGLKLIKAKVLLISASSDLLFPPAQIEKIVENMKANGNSVTYFKLQGRGGHYDGIAEIDQAEKVIRKFLSPKFLGISSW